MKKPTVKSGRKKADRPRPADVDARLELLLRAAEAAARKAEADRGRLSRLEARWEKEVAENRKAENARAEREIARAKEDAARAKREADRAKREADREEAALRRDKELTRMAEKSAVEAESRAREAESRAREAESRASAAESAAREAEANRNRLAELEDKLSKDRANNENHRRNSSRVLENAFAASLPRVMKAAHGIVIAPKDVQIRARKGRKRREYDFVAPNGEVVLVGEVKTRFRLADVNQLARALLQFRVDYPEYAGLKLYGVVAGGTVDDDALADALDAGFVVLRMEGAEAHPATGKNYTPTAH